MIGFYDYTVILTYMSFVSGMMGIILAFNGKILPAVFCLMFSGLCDMFDGRVARTKKKRTVEERHFGIQLDSLADLVCFGVLPAVIGYSLGLKSIYFLLLLLLFPLAGLIRLAYFNVLEIVRNSTSPVKEYTGLPITSSALIFPVLFIFQELAGDYFTLIYGATMLVVGVLFISKIKIKKPTLKTMIGFIVFGFAVLLLILMRRFM